MRVFLQFLGVAVTTVGSLLFCGVVIVHFHFNVLYYIIILVTTLVINTKKLPKIMLLKSTEKRHLKVSRNISWSWSPLHQRPTKLAKRVFFGTKNFLKNIKELFFVQQVHLLTPRRYKILYLHNYLKDTWFIFSCFPPKVVQISKKELITSFLMVVGHNYYSWYYI